MGLKLSILSMSTIDGGRLFQGVREEGVGVEVNSRW